MAASWMDPLTLALIGFSLLLAANIVLLWRIVKRPALDEARLGAYVAAGLNQSGLPGEIGAVRALVGQVGETAEELSRLFTVQHQRGSLGEAQLEEILRDVVPADRLAIRTNLPLVGTPDAAIRTRSGWVCIDSKFPLDAYRMVVEANGDGAQRTGQFLRGVEGHLEAIASKYVRPDAGTTPYAVAFIPSEAVYTFVQQRDPALSRRFAQRGVLLASPSTLTTHASLIVMGVRAETLSERAKEIQSHLVRIDQQYGALRESWDTLRRHLKNANEQAAKTERALDEVGDQVRTAAR